MGTNPWGPNPSWAPGGPDWLWFVTAGVLALVVLVLLFVAFVRGRSRGRARCPKCWYGMAAHAEQDPPCTCPECGEAIRKPRQLYKTRRRWKLAGVCVLLALAATASGLLPKVRRDGPLSVAPTWLVIRLDTYRWPAGGDSLGVPQSPMQEAAFRELYRRNTFPSFDADDWRWWLRTSRVLDPAAGCVVFTPSNLADQTAPYPIAAHGYKRYRRAGSAQRFESS